jgi:hypothetical protein
VAHGLPVLTLFSPLFMYPNGMILFELDSSKSVRFREDQFLVYGSLILVNYLLNRVLKISKV